MSKQFGTPENTEIRKKKRYNHNAYRRSTGLLLDENRNRSLYWRQLLGEELTLKLIQETHSPENMSLVKAEFKKAKDTYNCGKPKGVYANARRDKLVRAASTAT